MAIQTNYNRNLLPAVLGGRATEVPATVASRSVETPGGLGFGVPVMQGAGDKGVMAYAAPSRFLGITLLDRSTPSGDWIPQYSSASVVTKGGRLDHRRGSGRSRRSRLPHSGRRLHQC